MQVPAEGRKMREEEENRERREKEDKEMQGEGPTMKSLEGKGEGKVGERKIEKEKSVWKEREEE